MHVKLRGTVSKRVRSYLSLYLCLFIFFAPSPASAKGPLRVHPSNPRYFTDDTGRAIYLAGSHTWANLQDMGTTNPPAPFDYPAFLDWLEAQGHNFFKLYVWEQARYENDIASDDYWITPHPFQRTGPGLALDGEPKFDVEAWNEDYFHRLRMRVAEAGRRGMYVAVMLFNGWSIEPIKGTDDKNNPWRGHPFNGANNVRGLNGSSDLGSMIFGSLWPAWARSGRGTHVDVSNPVNQYQKRYVAKVIDTVNAFDNVLYEISNESPAESSDWQYDMIRFIRQYEASKPNQHPIGITAMWPEGSDLDLFSSPADWVSPNNKTHDYLNDPPESDGRKVVISDTDHLCGICGTPQWVWKSFTRGINPIFMDVYDGSYPGESHHNPKDPKFTSIRKQLGYTATYSRKLDLRRMTPQARLASTRYCLANPGPPQAEYLVYAPGPGDTIMVDLTGTRGLLVIEWFNPQTGRIVSRGRIAGGGMRSFSRPFPGDAILYLKSISSKRRRTQSPDTGKALTP